VIDPYCESTDQMIAPEAMPGPRPNKNQRTTDQLRLHALILLMCLCFAGSPIGHVPVAAEAQPADTATAERGSNSSIDDDKKTVAALDTEYQAAVKINDASTMHRILADDFVLVGFFRFGCPSGYPAWLITQRRSGCRRAAAVRRPRHASAGARRSSRNRSRAAPA